MTKFMVFLVVVSACASEATTSESSQKVKKNGCHLNPQGNCVCDSSPIIIDMNGDGFDLTSPENGVVFKAPGRDPMLWSWTSWGTNDAWLALDRDGDEQITDLGELFGDLTEQPVSETPNGFAALAGFDLELNGGNGDGKIDAADQVFQDLLLWRDVNHDGISQSSELLHLVYSGISEFDLAYKYSGIMDAHGNEFRYRSTVVADEPVAPTVYDVWLQAVPVPNGFTPETQNYTKWTCWAWGYAITKHAGVKVLCNNRWVLDGTIVTAGGGQLSRLVARTVSSTVSKADAISRAREWVFGDMLGPHDGEGVESCFFAPWPDPDLFRLPPYDDYDYEQAARVKCSSEIIITGGGGGGGSCT